MDEDVVFEVESVLGGTIVLRQDVWDLVRFEKHPRMGGRLDDVRLTASNPDEVRRSNSVPDSYLFYRVDGIRRFVCVVVHSATRDVAYVATAYETVRVKQGELLWPR